MDSHSTKRMATNWQSGAPEAEAAVARAMGWTWRQNGCAWWINNEICVTARYGVDGGMTTDDRWIGPMLLRIRELASQVEVKGNLNGWCLVVALPADGGETTRILTGIQAETLHEAVWRCLLAVATRTEEDADVR